MNGYVIFFLFSHVGSVWNIPNGRVVFIVWLSYDYNFCLAV